MQKQHSALAQILRRLLDETNLMDRSEWAAIIRVSPGAISHWVTDEHVPKPEHFRALRDVLLFDTRVPTQLIEEFEALADRPASEVTPHGARIGETLGHYMLKPVRDAFSSTVAMSPSWIQETVLRNGTEECWRLRESGSTRPSVSQRRHELFYGSTDLATNDSSRTTSRDSLEGMSPANIGDVKAEVPPFPRIPRQTRAMRKRLGKRKERLGFQLRTFMPSVSADSPGLSR